VKENLKTRQTAGEKPGRIFYGWRIVAAVAVGLYLGYVPIIGFTFGVFFNPISSEFGWSRAQISLAFSISLLALTFSLPIAGRLVDRIGPRRVILPSATLFGLAMMSFYFLSRNIWHYYAIYLVLGIVGGGISPVPYYDVIARWFDRRRGLALGLAMLGAGLSEFTMPALVQSLIRSQGWRLAYVAVGLMIVAITVPTVLLFLKETPQEMALSPDGETRTVVPTETVARPILSGVSQREAWRSGVFWTLSIGMFFVSMSLGGCLVHLVPMFTDRGMSAREAALTASALGGANLLGRVGAGYLLDRILAGYVAGLLFVGSALGVLMLWAGAAGGPAYLSALLLGLGMGAEGDIMAYVVSRYFGLKSFGEIYGYVLAIYTVGAMTGPILMGLDFDHLGSYRLVLGAFVLVTMLGAVLMTRLGPYPSWTVQPKEAF
jgi:MFS family permease